MRARWQPILATLLALAGASAAAHNYPGVERLSPGKPFTLFAMKALLPDPKAGYRVGQIDFPPLRGEAVAFLVVDPGLTVDVAEALRFQKLVRTLHHSHAFLVAPPSRSQDPAALARHAREAGFTLPILVDDRDIFPFVFSLGMAESPRYEIFDRSWTLVLESPSRLDQRIPGFGTVAQALRRLDEGEPVEGAILSPAHSRPRR